MTGLITQRPSSVRAPGYGPQVQSHVNMTTQSPRHAHSGCYVWSLSPHGGAYNYNYDMQMITTMGMPNMGIGQPQLYSPNNPYAYQAMQQPMYSPRRVVVAPQGDASPSSVTALPMDGGTM